MIDFAENNKSRHSNSSVEKFLISCVIFHVVSPEIYQPLIDSHFIVKNFLWFIK